MGLLQRLAKNMYLACKALRRKASQLHSNPISVEPQGPVVQVVVPVYTPSVGTESAA